MHWLATQPGTQGKAERTGRDQLRDHDEEIEDAHVHAHLRRGHTVGQQRIGQRQDRCPGEADADHRQQQPVWIADEHQRDQPGTAQPQIDQVAPAQADHPHHRRDQYRSQRGETVVGTKQHAHPVGAFVVGHRLRIGRTEVGTGHRGGGVDPHRKQREPREELHPRQPTHGHRHRAQVADDGRQHVRARQRARQCQQQAVAGAQAGQHVDRKSVVEG
ncbi:hypothetical protein G6F35_015089 [Rhizopus arrhizus]|nr:hypothetical protein G6F35_015089 [Rhizopus arrhizus]